MNWLIDWFNGVLRRFQQYFSHITATAHIISPVLGWALKCFAQGHTREKNPEDPVRLEPRTPGLRVKHFTTEPRWTLEHMKKKGDRCNVFDQAHWIVNITWILYFFLHNWNWLIDCLYGVQRRFQQYFSYIAMASEPIHAFLEFF